MAQATNLAAVDAYRRACGLATTRQAIERAYVWTRGYITSRHVRRRLDRLDQRLRKYDEVPEFLKMFIR